MHKLLLGFSLTSLLLAMAGCQQQDNTSSSGSGSSGGRSETSGTAAGSTKSGDKIKLGFIVKQPEEPWFQLEWKFAEEAGAKDGFELVKIGAPDGEKALAAIDNLAAGGAKGFVICTPDVKLGPAIAAKAKSNNLKFITVDDQFVGADGKYMTDVHHLGISARKIGEDVGKTLYDQMTKRSWKPEDSAVCAVTFDELETARDRTDGAHDALTSAGFPAARIFPAPQKTSDVPGAFDAVNILLTQHPDVKHWLIYGMNDSAVMGAVRAMEGRQLGPDSVCGVGINGTDCITEFKKDKPTGFYGSMLLAPKRHGYETADMLYQWVANGKEPPLDTRTVGMLITRENYQQVLKEQGLE
jgi:L-arabinose transport system substrate-binding protein